MKKFFFGLWLEQTKNNPITRSFIKLINQILHYVSEQSCCKMYSDDTLSMKTLPVVLYVV